MKTNVLYFGDNLHVLREKIPDASVDLVYADPPFNSSRNYFVIFRDRGGGASAAQEEAFADTWNWTEDSEAWYREMVVSSPNQGLATTMRALRETLRETPMMAYLVAMSIRLVELHRVLNDAGSFYLHCDPTASHYLKIVLDVIFGPNNFRNELTWKRTHAHGNVGRNYGSIADILLWYSKTARYTWNQPFASLSPEETASKYPHADPDGRRWQSVTLRNPGVRPNLHFPFTACNGVTYQPHPNGWSCNLERLQRYDREGRLHFPARPNGALRLKMYADESLGERVQNIWTDIAPIGALAAERLGYPTQKPLALLERIINASSNEADVVLDPFCGCGTAVVAAHKLHRKWVGIDITAVAVGIIKSRLEDAFHDLKGKVQVDGFPTDLEAARTLFEMDPYRFQVWACTLIGAYPLTKKGADKGVDGWLNFIDVDDSPHRSVVQVKGGKVTASQVRDFCHVVEREKAELGFFLCLAEPTKPMRDEAAAMQSWESAGRKIYPRVQILTIGGLLSRSEAQRLPPQDKLSLLGYKAQRQQKAGSQTALFEDR